MLHVDDEAPNDPGPNTPTVSDPDEDGSPEHPFDMIQEAIDASCGRNHRDRASGQVFRERQLSRQEHHGDKFGAGRTVCGFFDTVIDGNDLGPVVTFEGGEGPGGTLSGFVLTHGKGTEARRDSLPQQQSDDQQLSDCWQPGTPVTPAAWWRAGTAIAC